MTSQEFKEKCIELRKQDLSLGELIKILKRPKTTIYFHIQNIPLSRSKINKIIRKSTKRINEFNHRRKGIPTKPFKKINKWTPQNINLVSHFLFDGELKYGSCIYHNRSKVLISKVKNEMKRIYNFRPAEAIDSLSKVIRISFHNVALSSYLKGKSIELLREIEFLPLELQREFLRTFFEDEGSIYFQKKRNSRRVKGYQYNNETLFLVQKLLKNFGIESKVDSRFHEIIISRRENLEKFAKEINFSPGVKVNGLRSNSIWKQDLEKRDILRRATDSYQT